MLSISGQLVGSSCARYLFCSLLSPHAFWLFWVHAVCTHTIELLGQFALLKREQLASFYLLLSLDLIRSAYGFVRRG